MKKINLLSLFFLGFIVNIWGQSPEDSIALFRMLDDFVITAEYAPTDVKNAVHQIHVIKKEEIAQKNVNNLAELLTLEPSIRISNDKILGSSMSLQGISGQNVKIMIDGVPVIGRVGDNIDLSQVLLNNIERIEIVEGPLSVNYGTDALGGVINLITKKAQLQKVEAGLKSRMEDPASLDFNAWTGIHLGAKFLLRLNAGYYKFDGFSPHKEGEEEEENRNVLWNPKEKWAGDALLRYRWADDNSLAYTFSTFKENIINLGEMRRPVFKPYAYDDYYKTQRFSHSLLYEGSLSEHFYLNSTAAYNRFDRNKNSYRYEFDTDEKSLLPGAQDQDTTQFEVFMFRSTLASKFQGKINFQLGVDLNRENAFGQRIIDEQSDKEGHSMAGDYAIFGSVTYVPLPALSLQAGLRAAHHTRYEAPLVPSLNLKYNFSKKLSLRASYGKGFRSPTLKELFFYFVDSNHFIVGNSDLKAEVSDNVQAVLSYNREKTSTSVALFYNDIRNKIDFQEFRIVDGQMVPGTGTLEFSYFNQNRFKSIGSSVRFRFKHKNLEGSTAMSGRGRFNLLSDDYTEVPPFSFMLESNAELTYKFPKLGMRISGYFRNYDKLIRYYSDEDEDGNPIILENILDGYTLLDCNVSKSFWKERIQLTAGAKNLLDITETTYKEQSGGSHGSSSGSIDVSWGRTWFAGMTVNLGW